jgi:hypothetical protein
MEARWRETAGYPQKSANGAGIESAIARVARGHLRLIRTSELIECGLSHSSIRDRVRSGRLFRLHHGVYATHPPPFSREQLWLAGVLACGQGSLLSDWPAASHWRITDRPPSLTPTVTVPTHSGRSRPGITVHRRGPIDPRDFRVKDGIPLTSVDLVLVHLAPEMDELELEVMLVAASSLGLLKRHRLAELVEDRPGRPGISRLRTLLGADLDSVRSPPELWLLPLAAEAGLPHPRLNYPVPVAGGERTITVDCAWPELRLAIELDSQRFHGDWQQAEEDRERDLLLALEGWLVHRFVRRQIAERRAECAARLARLHHLRASAAQ